MATVSEMKRVVQILKEDAEYRKKLVNSNKFAILQTLYWEFFGAGSLPLTKVERTNKGEKLSPIMGSVGGEAVSSLAQKQWDEFWSSITDKDILKLKPRD